jgi:hypothetical protein
VKEHHLEEGVALSADLSKASDRIPFSIGYTVLKTAMDTFYDMEDEEETTNYNNIDAATILTGPMRFPDGTKTKRGLLMGLPTTWPILSLLNMACFEFGAQKLDRHRYSICGDDLIALCEERSSQNYQANLQECSLRINAKKHLVIPLVRGRTVGAVFTEEVFLFKTGEVKTPAGKKPEMWDFIAHKILTSTTQTHHIQTPHPGAILQCKPRGILETGSKYTTIKMCFDQLASTPGKRGRVAIELAKDLHKDIIRKLEASGIPPYWPRELGGAGLPGKQSAPPSLRKRIAALLTLQPLESSRIIRKFKRIWEPRSRSDAAEQADIDLEYTITKIPEHKTGTSSQEALSLLRPTFIGIHTLRGKDKISSIKKTSLPFLKKQISSEIHKLPEWKSCNPIKPTKAIALAKRSLEGPRLATEYVKALKETIKPPTMSIFTQPKTTVYKGKILEVIIASQGRLLATKRAQVGSNG